MVACASKSAGSTQAGCYGCGKSGHVRRFALISSSSGAIPEAAELAATAVEPITHVNGETEI